MFYAVIVCFYCFGFVYCETTTQSFNWIPNKGIKVEANGSNELNISNVLLEQSTKTETINLREPVKELERTNDYDKAELDENTTSKEKKGTNEQNSNYNSTESKVKIENVTENLHVFDASKEKIENILDPPPKHKTYDSRKAITFKLDEDENELKILTKSRLNYVLKNLFNKHDSKKSETLPEHHPKILLEKFKDKNRKNKRNRNHHKLLRAPTNENQLYEKINKFSEHVCSNIKPDVFKAISRQSKQLKGDIIIKITPNPHKTSSSYARIKVSFPPKASEENKHSLVCRYNVKSHDLVNLKNVKNNMDIYYHYYWEEDLNAQYGVPLSGSDEYRSDLSENL